MASVKASDWKNVMNLTDKPTDTQAEYILDLAIDTLNLFGATLSNMTGETPGSKTVTLTSKQRGAVFHAARAIYYGFFKEIKVASTGGVTVSVTDLVSNPEVVKTIKEAAKRLEAKDTGIPFVVAHADS